MTDLLYAYAVLPSDSPALAALAADEVQGIGGTPVRAITEGTVAGAVGDVPAADFDEAPLNRNLADMDWLGPRAAIHQAVNAYLFDAGDATLPLSFGAVFRSEESLRRMLRERRDEIAERLEAVRGCSEWVVTVRRDTVLAAAALDTGNEAMAQLRREITSSSPGRRYLLERKVDEVRRRELQNTDARLSDDLAQAISPLVRQTFREPIVPQDGQSVIPIARASLLVERAREGALAAALDALVATWQERGYVVERTGPWPTYRFGGLRATTMEAAGS